ncbi:hypothetical protein [Dickeya fangzhongdai]
MTPSPLPFDEPQALAHLAAIDAHWARLIDGVGHIRFESRPAREPYDALIRAVASQQLSNRAAAAIRGQGEVAFEPLLVVRAMMSQRNNRCHQARNLTLLPALF